MPAPLTSPPSLDPAAAVAEIADLRAARHRDESPFDAIDVVRRTRLGALRLPPELGGAGVSVRELFATVIELAAADPDVPHILRTHFSFTDLQLLAPDSPGRDHWLGLVSGGAIFGNATSELGPRQVGGPGAFATVVERAGDGEGGDGTYRLTGEKYYCTGTRFSDYVAVTAVREATDVVSAIIPTDRAGITIEDDWDGIGQRLTGTGTTRFDAVEVLPGELVVRGPVDAPLPHTHLGPLVQLWLHGIGAGILRSLVDDAVTLVRGRGRSFHHAPTALPVDDPLVQQVVGRLSAAAVAYEAVVLHAADSIDAALATRTAEGKLDPDALHDAALRTSQAKVHLDEVGPRAATLLFDAGGASATKRSADLDRHWRNLRTLASHNPTIYKAQAIGAHVVRGDRLPEGGFF